MKKISLVSTVLFFIVLGAACTINFPYEAFDDYGGVQVTMQVTPDDADVLLNGKWIGSAYEFSTPRSALRLASRHNELILKKKGYGEEAVDLSSYPSRNITLKIELEAEEPRDAGVIIPRPPTISGGQIVPGTAKADGAKTEPLLPLPAEKPAPGPERTLTSIILTVTPIETAIYIDGKFWGLSPEGGKIENLRLKPGKYVFEAFKPGFAACKIEVVVPKAATFTLAIALQKKNPPIL